MSESRLPGGKRAAAAAAGLMLHAILAAIAIIVLLVAIAQPAIGMSLEDLEVADGSYALLLVLRVLLFFLAGLLFLMWIFVTYDNTAKFSGTTYSPGWAVASFFIPFLNLVRPYTIVQEMWRYSETGPVPKNSPLVSLWWLGYLGWLVVMSITAEFIPDSGILSPGLRLSLLAGDAFALLGAICGAIMVFRIRKRQNQQMIAGKSASPLPQSPLTYPAY